MAIHELTYVPSKECAEVMLGCAANQIVKEHGEAIAKAFAEISVVIDVDDDWGICRILYVNGKEVVQD